MATALEVAGYAAQVTYVGINVGDSVATRPGLIVEKALAIKGQVGSVGVWPAAIRFLDRLKCDLSLMVSQRYPLSSALDALKAAEDRSANIKVHVHADVD